jgi:hypothetical protein
VGISDDKSVSSLVATRDGTLMPISARIALDCCAVIVTLDLEANSSGVVSNAISLSTPASVFLKHHFDEISKASGFSHLFFHPGIKAL